jgi:hypothetical protein
MQGTEIGDTDQERTGKEESVVTAEETIMRNVTYRYGFSENDRGNPDSCPMLKGVNRESPCPVNKKEVMRQKTARLRSGIWAVLNNKEQRNLGRSDKAKTPATT